MTSGTLHVALSGFSGPDAAGAGPSVARALREGWPTPLEITALVEDETTPSAWRSDLIDRLVLLPASPAQPDAIIEPLLALHRQEPLSAVIAGTSSHSLSLAKAQSLLVGAGIGSFQPDAAIIEQLEPVRLRELMSAHDIQMPTVGTFDRTVDLGPIADTLAYPVTLLSASGRRSPVFGPAQLLAVARSEGGVSVQSFVHGDTYMVACLAKGGKALSSVAVRCLGKGADGLVNAATVIDDQEVLDVAGRVIAALSWRGPLEIELRRQARSGKLIVSYVGCHLPEWCMLTHWAGSNLAVAALRAICSQEIVPASVRLGTMFVRGVHETTIDAEDHFCLRRNQFIEFPKNISDSGGSRRPEIDTQSLATGSRIAVTGLSSSDVINPGSGVARALRSAGNGSKLYGLAYSDFDAGAYEAELFDRIVRLEFGTSANHLLEQLVSAHERAPFDVLIPCLDGELAFVIEIEQQLADLGIATLLPPRAALDRRSKLALAAKDAQREWGTFSLPYSEIADDLNEALAVARTFKLPAMAKGPEAYCVPVDRISEVTAAWHHLDALGADQIILQEKIEGPSYAISVVCDRNHDVVSSISVKKISLCARGSTWSAINVRLPELERDFARFLKAIEWVGPAEGEFICDRVTDRFFLFEVNPRFTGWISFSAALGQNQPDIAARLARGEEPVPPATAGPRIFVRAKNEINVPPARFAAFTTRRVLKNDETKAV